MESSSLERAAKLDYENILAAEEITDAPAWEDLSPEQKQEMNEEFRYYSQFMQRLEEEIAALSPEAKRVRDEKCGAGEKNSVH